MSIFSVPSKFCHCELKGTKCFPRLLPCDRNTKSKLSKITVLTAGLLIISGHAVAENWYSIGLKAEHAGLTYEAIDAYEKSALQGVAAAMYAASRLHDALGSNDEALQWLETAAHAGDMFAQLDFGRKLLAIGNEIDRARTLLEQAADSGSGEASYLLIGLVENPLARLTEAADRGVAAAMLELAEAYENEEYGLSSDPAISNQLRANLVAIQGDSK